MKHQRVRKRFGSVVLDKRSKTWHFLWWESGKRRSRVIGSTRDLPSKASAWHAAKPFVTAMERHDINNADENETTTVKQLVERYEVERLPRRAETARVYRSWLYNHILPNWGDKPITALQPRPVELWVGELDLSPKSKAHIRNLLRILLDFAMWSGALEVSRNPIELVAVKGATRRIRKPRSLTFEQFHKLYTELRRPFSTMSLLAACLGLRVSELLALRWRDVDWLQGKLTVERAIVRQIVDDVKTEASRRSLAMDHELLQVLKLWKQQSSFNSEGDWVFASPLKLGRLPYSYTGVWREIQRAALAAGIGCLGTHAFRHTYRSWLDAVGTPIAVQQKLMRHSDIRTTMNIYGDVITDEMGQAHSRVVKLALPPD